MSASRHDHPPEVDPVTGHDTTGHDWGGIRELNTPFPKIALVFLALAFAWSVGVWVLLPAWPTGHGFTKGALALDQGQEAIAGFKAIEAGRQAWMGRFAGAAPDFAGLAADAPLMEKAMPAAARLFRDNCAACHGTAGQGGPGFPALNDADWLWGGDPATVAQTVTAGINADDPDTRVSQMPVFDFIASADRHVLADYIASLPTGPADPTGKAAGLFADNCATCHGDHAQGGLLAGAPSLTDGSVIYGQDAVTVYTTLTKGRQGLMPAWKGRLDAAEINLLALYVSRLPEGGAR